MITKQAILDGIAECQGVRTPNAGTCQKLADLLTILHYMYGDEPDIQGYSYSATPETVKEVDYQSETEFSQAIRGKRVDMVWEIIDELMTVLQAIKPGLYDGVLRKINNI